MSQILPKHVNAYSYMQIYVYTQASLCLVGKYFLASFWYNTRTEELPHIKYYYREMNYLSKALRYVSLIVLFGPIQAIIERLKIDYVNLI